MGAVSATIASAGEHAIFCHLHRVATNKLITHLINHIFHFTKPFDGVLGQHLGPVDLVLDQADPLNPCRQRGQRLHH
jgi:hypothetical protein